MPQVQLPIFPKGTTHLTPEIAFRCQDGKICYFNGHLPVFIHDEEDLATFRLYSSQLIINGNVSQAEVSRAFGIPLVTVKRYVKLFREKGAKGFYQKDPKSSASVLKNGILVQAQELLDEGMSVPEVGKKLEILSNTIHKAIDAGRLYKNFKKKVLPRVKRL